MKGLGGDGTKFKSNEHRRLFLTITTFVVCYILSSFRLLPSTSYFYTHDENKFNAPPAVQRNSQPQILSPLHASFALSGNHPGVFAEFEVALKSVLLNAPLERKLILHILADEDAYRSLDELYIRTDLPKWTSRNQVEIHAYDVTPLMKMLEQRIKDVFKNMGPKFKWWQAVSIHTMGTFYRLIAHLVIPASSMVEHLLYIDTDVIVLANLEGLLSQVLQKNKPDALFYWGERMNAGFLVLNVPRMEEIWTLAARSPLQNISESNKQDANDQLIFMSVNVTHPNEVGILESGWEMAITHLWPEDQNELGSRYPNVGMLHYNGGSANKDAYFSGEGNWIHKVQGTWGNGKYYVTLPWTWARYQARTMAHVGSNGYPIKICSWGPVVESSSNNSTSSSSSSSSSLRGDEDSACALGEKWFYRD